MNIRTITIAVLLLFTVGCAGTTSPTPIDYNPENDVRVDELTGLELPPMATADYIKAADYKDVIVGVSRLSSFRDEHYQAEIQEWEVHVTNNNQVAKCVGVVWRLMDFKFITEYPTTMMVPSRTKMLLGTMLGEYMEIDGVLVAPAPSGYVHKIQVLQPNWDADEGFECMYLAEEEDVDEQ